MKIAILQRDILWRDIERNLERAYEALDGVGDADLIVLPEMFATGFAAAPEGVAERASDADGNGGGRVVAWMKRVAAEKDCAVCGSVAVDDGGKHYNRCYFVRPDGTAEHYDKRHLFGYGGENEHYTAGQERVVVDFRGVRILLQVCYDLRFPVFARNRGDYDVALYVASWPTSRIAVWRALLVARALENQCYVVGVNRVGSDPVCDYSGESMAIDPYGRIIADAGSTNEATITAELNMEKLAMFREKFPVLNDRDDFTLAK